MNILNRVFKDMDFLPALLIVAILGLALQLTGAWVTMLFAGVFGGFFTKRYSKAFLVGFLGVGIAWSIIFAYLVVTSPALAIAGFFINMLGLNESFSITLIVFSILIGALLGGFSGVLGRAVLELVEELSAEKSHIGETIGTSLT
jgi:hypothetical protein